MIRWQSVSAAVPTEGARCIVRLKSGLIREAERSRIWKGGWGVITAVTKDNTTVSGRGDVTHWVPYPLPPECHHERGGTER